MSDYEEDENKLSKDEIERFRQGESDDEHDYFENVETEELDDEDDTDTRDAEVPRPLKDMNAEEQAEGALLLNTPLSVEIKKSEEGEDPISGDGIEGETQIMNPEVEKPRLTHAALARHIANELKGKITFCPDKELFMLYDTETEKWVLDKKGLKIIKKIRLILEGLPQIITQNPKEQEDIYYKIENCSVPGSVARELQNYATEKPIVEFDADINLLGVKNGVIELDALKFRPGRPEDYVTKSVNAMFDPTAICPRFEQFISEIMSGNQDFIDLMQTWLGYFLLGDNPDNALLFMQGRGANGKSVLMNVIQKLLGNYCNTVPISVMIKSQRTTVGDDVMAILGYRVLLCRELSKDDKLNAAKIKLITGGDSDRVRGLYDTDYTTVEHIAKFVIGTNEVPLINDTSNGIWRRIMYVPFQREFNESEQIKRLDKILIKEANGILNWALAGLKLYDEKGFVVPEMSTKIKGELREEVNYVEKFISENYVINDDHKEPARQLHEAFLQWVAATTNAPHLSAIKFGRELTSLGIRYYRAKNSFYGVEPITQIEKNEEPPLI